MLRKCGEKAGTKPARKARQIMQEILFAEITVVSAPPFVELVEEIIRETTWSYRPPGYRRTASCSKCVNFSDLLE